jgi:MYXO-CTERM domain-containing protein
LRDGGVPGSGGAAGRTSGNGGSGGSLVTTNSGVGTTPGPGGSGGSADAHPSDAGRTSAHKSGCSCALGDGGPGETSWRVPLLLAGIAVLLWRRRGLRPSIAIEPTEPGSSTTSAPSIRR